ncbi:MAG TPA: tripartite tricarboxylate transporter substrate binding protein [Burkholderiales bacterium]|jgi:tripartite-type tricarboxylate transporter receptor subunit TctC|nr:tripartite tricarboxylate transporter substrate binding protein [Burkholderiales bacterium]
MRKLLALAGSLLLAAAAHAQQFPSKPVTLIVPWPAGGSTDIYFRKLGEITARHLGQPLVIENRPGGSGMNGPATMAKTARPDGYTISQLAITAFRVPHMQKVDWDPITDFTYIVGLAGYTFGIVVKADSPFKTFQDLLAYARANPGRLSYATPGTGTSLHLAMEEIAAKAGVQFLHVPFKGYGDGAIALMGGHVMVQVDSTGWAKQVDAGAQRLLATLGDKRTRWNAPTVKELGVDTVSNSPFGLVGPKGMPREVVKVLHDAFKKSLDDPEYLKMLAQLDQPAWYMSSEDYGRWAVDMLKAERATIERVGLLLK